jgi:methylphosphotriester-DNA--protein-cysteine methyltransferase
MAALIQLRLDLLLQLSKAGKALEEICEALQVGAETGLTARAQKFDITPKQMRKSFHTEKARRFLRANP